MDVTNPSHPRYATNKLMALLDEGMLDRGEVLLMALGALSDDEVYEMCQRNDVFLFPDDEDDDEEWDATPSPASMGLSRDFKKD